MAPSTEYSSHREFEPHVHPERPVTVLKLDNGGQLPGAISLDPAPAAETQAPIDALFNALDKNGDGRLSREEFESFQRSVEVFPSKPAVLAPPPVVAKPVAAVGFKLQSWSATPSGSQMFTGGQSGAIRPSWASHEVADVKQDLKKVNHDMSASQASTAADFSAMDLNQDGLVSKEEFMAYIGWNEKVEKCAQDLEELWEQYSGHRGTLWLDRTGRTAKEEQEHEFRIAEAKVKQSYLGLLRLDRWLQERREAIAYEADQKRRQERHEANMDKLRKEAEQIQIVDSFEAWFVKQFNGTPPPIPGEEPSEIAIEAKRRKDQITAAIAKKDATFTKMGEFHEYGSRLIRYSSNLPVVEQNYGVVVNAEFATPSWKASREAFVLDDEAIRNRDWWTMGLWMQRLPDSNQVDPPADYWTAKQADGAEKAAAVGQTFGAAGLGGGGMNADYSGMNTFHEPGYGLGPGCDYRSACDIAGGSRFQEHDYRTEEVQGLLAQRRPQAQSTSAARLQRIERRFDQEFLPAEMIAEFYADPARVMYEELV